MSSIGGIRADGALRCRQRVLVAVWAVCALAAMFARGRELGIDRAVSARLRYHAIPVAMSVLYYGHPHDYTALYGLAFGFQTLDSIENRLTWAATYLPPPDETTYYWAADDRGMADYVIGAFALLGPRVESLYEFYFVVLGASVLLFLLDLGWHPAMSATLIFALGALYTCLSLIPLGNLTVTMFEPGSLFEPRTIELLSFVATLHLGLTALADSRWSAGRIATVAAQALILAGCYHARSSVGWEVLFVGLVVGGAWIARLWDAPAQPRSRFAVLTPAMCLAAALALMLGYQRYAYNPRYFQDMGARTIWHNALMGLSLNRYLGETYALGIDDAAIIGSVTAYLERQHDPRIDARWTPRNILDSLGGAAVFDWSQYEEAARDRYAQFWRTEPRSMLHLYVIDKPREIAHVVRRAIERDSAASRNRQGLYLNPFTATATILVLPGLIIACASRLSFAPLLIVGLVLLACSTMPGWLFYPVVHTMMGVFASIPLVVYLFAAAVGSTACRLLFGPPQAS